CIEKDGVRIDDNDDMIAEKEIFSKIHAKLADHGFILRYLEGKDDITGYAYEPWHFRYVDSPEIAHEITDAGLTLEEYLGADAEAAE
ncbi:MAG: D-alanyl-D-alanine carboxypeptidase family protein, partial [Clostridia bacterium]|nr:D-alanyl-D-alanine carboxypeptidase family protein [Clostridia bacterium]